MDMNNEQGGQQVCTLKDYYRQLIVQLLQARETIPADKATIVLHPGSTYLHFGLSTDPTPHSIPHLIAYRSRKDPAFDKNLVVKDLVGNNNLTASEKDLVEKDPAHNKGMVVKDPADDKDLVVKDPADDKYLVDMASTGVVSKQSTSTSVYQDESLILKHRNEVVVRILYVFVHPVQ